MKKILKINPTIPKEKKRITPYDIYTKFHSKPNQTTILKVNNRHTIQLLKTLYSSELIKTGFAKHTKYCCKCSKEISITHKILHFKILRVNYFLCLRCANEFVRHFIKGMLHLNKEAPLNHKKF